MKRPRRRQWRIGSAMLLLLVAGLLAEQALRRSAPDGRSEPHPADATSASPLAEATPESPQAGTTAVSAPGPSALPASLRDTDADGELALDARGRFDPTPEALVLFDHYFAASGEEPEAVLEQRIATEIRRRLSGQPAEDALALLARHQQYRHAMRALTLEGTPPADLERRFQRIREERRKAFGAELAAKLFGEEERVVGIDLERHRVAADATLSPDEKERRLRDLEASLPEGVRAQRQNASAISQISKQVGALRSAGASDAEVFAVRERALGPEAAGRLAQLDREEAAWGERVAAYRAARDRLLADATLPPADRDARLAALRADRFDEREQLRIRALDETPQATP